MPLVQAFARTLQAVRRRFFAVAMPDSGALIAAVRARKLTYCGPPKLETIADRIADVRRRRVPGIYVEAGCALGGSAIVIATLKPARTPFCIYDLFGMIPPPTADDGPDAHARFAEIASGQSKGIGDNKYYGYMENLQAVVAANLREFGVDLERQRVRLIPGLFEKTLHPDHPVAFAHVDCDWYNSVKVCIDRLAPRMSPGGVMVFDDYSSYSGCRRAVDEFLAATPAFRLAGVKRSATVVREEERA